MTGVNWPAAWWVPSPNYNDRPEGVVVDTVVLHFISLPPYVYEGDDIYALFQNRLEIEKDPFYAQLEGVTVSSHYVLRRDGTLVCCVPPDKRAWHAGVSVLEGVTNVNDFSVGLEIEGSEKEPFTDVQYRVLVAWLHHMSACGIGRVTGHEFIAPGRKIDPGPFMDWAYLQKALAHTSLRFILTPQAGVSTETS